MFASRSEVSTKSRNMIVDSKSGVQPFMLQDPSTDSHIIHLNIFLDIEVPYVLSSCGNMIHNLQDFSSISTARLLQHSGNHRSHQSPTKSHVINWEQNAMSNNVLLVHGLGVLRHTRYSRLEIRL